MLVQESNKVGFTLGSRIKETPKSNNFIGKEIFFWIQGILDMGSSPKH